jgi:hypothetical protein
MSSNSALTWSRSDPGSSGRRVSEREDANQPETPADAAPEPRRCGIAPTLHRGLLRFARGARLPRSRALRYRREAFEQGGGMTGGAPAVNGGARVLALALLALLALVALSAPLSPLHAQIAEIAWDAAGRFEREMQVAPGKFGEVCGRLAKGQRVAWRFEAGAPLDFNIHHHIGQDVHYSENRRAQREAAGSLDVASEQDYCWMWSNKGAAPVVLRLSLTR